MATRTTGPALAPGVTPLSEEERLRIIQGSPGGIQATPQYGAANVAPVGVASPLPAYSPPTYNTGSTVGTQEEGQAWLTQHQKDIQNMLNAGGTLQSSQQSMSSSGAPLPNYTGAPKMLPYTPGSGAGIFNQVMSDPARLRNLMGGPVGRAPGVGPTPLGGGASPAPPGGPAGAGAPGAPVVGPEGSLPTDLLGQTAGNLSGALRGELPADVLNLLQQQAAEYGVGGGTSGSQFAGYAGLRNLGLTSLDRMKHAEDLLAQQFMTPAQKAELAERREERTSRERLERDRIAREQARFDAELAQKKLEFEREQAAVENELKFKQQQAELKALQGKYVGLPGYGGSGGDVLFGSQPYGSRGLKRYGVTTIT